ncbi:MAG: ABC transporter permease, partial [Planctomycetota bacterium]
LSVSGLRKLIAPLILGGLLIFGTMLSSVSDRRKEIFTLSALGLAPVHVAVLFFAEAAVYSVMGGMGGYLLSQLFARTVEHLAGFGWVTAPIMNYSSMNAMFSIVLVMLTVMASTVYPALKASRSANPGIQRKWRMPRPDGDEYDFPFPFTVSQYDMIGLISFLEEYFLAHRDRTVGAFAADDVRIDRRDGRFTLSATVWLRPFDQGVSQTFRMQAAPGDLEGIDEVHVQMHRRAGPPVIWRRSAAGFIDDIRQQFIFWRTIDEDMVDHYHRTTVTRFGLDEPIEERPDEA